MNNRYFCKILCLVSILFLLSAPSFAQTPDEFQERRQAVLENMETNSVLIMRSNPPAGEFEQFRQDNNFYYLTGLNEPNSALIMRTQPGGRRGRGAVRLTATLFMTPRNPARSDWDPQSLGFEGAIEDLGFEEVLPIGEFQTELENALTSRVSVFYMNYDRSRGLHTPLTADEDLFKKAREKGGNFEVRSPNNLLYPLRRIKSEIETEYLRMAIDITAEGHKEAMRSIKPGMAEYQLQSILEHVFAINGSQRVGFNSIVGSGPNSVILHWSANSRTMEDGDLVVVDIGAEYDMYTADVTRTIPVNGKFTDRQKDVYNIVLAAQQAGMDVLRPGVSWSDVNAAANDALIEGLQRIGLIKDRSELRNYYFHGLGHNIGLQVHDVGGLGTLEPGMHFTIEPGIYIREEGLGVRIEDDFLITETGYIHTSKNAPRTVEEIEAMMKKKGTDYARYLIKK